MSGLYSKEQKKERKKEKSLSEKLVFTASNKVALCLCTVATLIPVKKLFIAICYQVTYPQEKLEKHENLLGAN